MDRTSRQNLAIEKYRQTSIGGKNLCGTFNHCTGFGKTKEAIDIVNKLKAKQGNDISYIIVVPTTNLVKRWEGDLEKDNHQTLTIQGLIARKESLSTYFLIIDEIHKMAATEFSQIFELIKYTHILGLTATWKRLDGKEQLIAKYCPVIDIIPLEEGRRNNWVADYMIYAWGIEFNEKDKEIYQAINRQVEESMSYFMHDYDTVIGCCSKKDRFISGKFYRGATTYIEENPDIELHTREIINNVEVIRRVIEREDKIEVLTAKANICRNAIMKRKEYTDRALCKVDATIEAITLFNLKTVTFGTSTEMADKITDRLGKRARSYHSYIESQVLDLPNSKGKIVPKKVGTKKLLEMWLNDFENDKFDVLNTAKKADLGLDITGLSLGIDLGRTSDKGTLEQRIGRIVRIELVTRDGEEVIKEAIYLIIYIRGTKEESTLKYMLKNFSRVRWITNLNSIKV